MPVAKVGGVMSTDADMMMWLWGRLERALGGRSFEEVLPLPRALAGIDAAAEASEEVVLARRAAEKLRAGGRLLEAEVNALEMGLLLVRPALRIENGRLPDAPALELKGAARARIEALLPGIASVGWKWDIPFATAFQVSSRVMVTCAHVVEKLLQCSEDLARGHFVARFDADGRRPSEAMAIVRVLALHPAEDVAFLELAGDGPLVSGLRVAREPWLRRGEQVLVVGYPIYSAGTPLFLDALFENVYGVKRASPGELLGLEAGLLYHDCTTLPGSSGSPLLDPRTGLVIGIHTSGQFAVRNTAVSPEALYADVDLRALVSDWG
jgi:Trypsin-like peptidase domain